MHQERTNKHANDDAVPEGWGWHCVRTCVVEEGGKEDDIACAFHSICIPVVADSSEPPDDRCCARIFVGQRGRFACESSEQQCQAKKKGKGRKVGRPNSQGRKEPPHPPPTPFEFLF
jgi:hypothetical protein